MFVSGFSALSLFTYDFHDHHKLGKLTRPSSIEWTGMTLNNVSNSMSKAVVLLTQVEVAVMLAHNWWLLHAKGF